MTPRIRSDDPLRRACAWGALAGLVPFLLVLWDAGLRPLRGVGPDRLNGNFYDLQARALFHGNLDVPAGSLGIEAFVVDGRHYMYFGPFPALLRMPILLLTDRLDGKLTALSMLVGWFALAAAVTALVVVLRGRVRGDEQLGRGEAMAWALFVAVVTGGSAIVYVASQPWVYHEVYVWSSALTIATLAVLVAAWDRPSRRRVAALFGLSAAVMLTRLPAGWAMTLAIVATGVVIAVRGRRRAGLEMVGAGAVAWAIGTAVNLAKFGHVYLFPIAAQDWSSRSVHRQLVLLHNDNRIDGPQFFWTDLVTYLRPDGLRLTPVFPFITFPADPPGPIWGVHLDQTYRTGSVTALMPLLLGLTVWGAVAVWRRGSASLRIPLAGALVVTGGVMAFGYLAPRYTAEFIPVLALGGAIGLADIARRMAERAPTRRHVALGAMAVLAGYSVAANAATGIAAARASDRGGDLVAWISLQERISSITGHPLDDDVMRVDRLPADGPAGALAVVGECDAVYLASGETDEPWMPVQFRTWRLEVVIGDGGASPGTAPLMRFDGSRSLALNVQIGFDGRARLTLTGTGPGRSGDWLDVEPGDVVDVEVRGDTAHNEFVATATLGDGRSTVTTPVTEWSDRLSSVPVEPRLDLDDAQANAVHLGIDDQGGPPPGLCARLAT